MNIELECFKHLAVLQTTSKTKYVKFSCLRKILKLLRNADSREICTKLCYGSYDVFRALLLPDICVDTSGDDVYRNLDLDDVRCACIVILCLREMCRSRLEGADGGLRMALAENDVIHFVTNLLLTCSYRALHSAAISFMIVMAQDFSVFRSNTNHATLEI